MEIISKKKKYYDVEVRLNEAEIETIIAVFEQVAMMMRYPVESMGGMRQEIYKKLQEIIKAD